MKEELFDLKNQIIQLRELSIRQDKTIKKLTEDLEISEKKVQSFEFQLSKVNSTFNDDKEQIKKRSEEIINKYKFTMENLQNRIETAFYIERLNNTQAKDIELLESQREIDKMNFNSVFVKREINYNSKLNEINKNSLDQINKMKKETEIAENKNLLSAHKLNLLINTELVNELCYSSNKIEQLIKQNHQLERDVKDLKYDIEVHSKIEKMLKEKNQSLTNALNKINGIRESSHTPNVELNKIDDFRTTFNRTGLSTAFSLSKTHFKGKLKINDLTKNLDKNNNLDSKIKILEKEILKSKSNNLVLSQNNIVLNEKMKNFQTKLGKFMRLLEDALENMKQNNEFKLIKEKISDEKINEFEFDNLSKKEQYWLLSYLINYIKPFLLEITEKKIEYVLNTDLRASSRLKLMKYELKGAKKFQSNFNSRINLDSK